MNVLLPLLLAATPAPVPVPGTVQPVVEARAELSHVQYPTEGNAFAWFFVVDDARHGRRLWKSDGTAAGTTPLPESMLEGLTLLTAWGDGGYAYVTGQNELVVEHPRFRGSVWLPESPARLTAFDDDTLIFPSSGKTWRFSAVDGGLEPISSTACCYFGSAAYGALRIANVGQWSGALWMTDGTAAGTRRPTWDSEGAPAVFTRERVFKLAGFSLADGGLEARLHQSSPPFTTSTVHAWPLAAASQMFGSSRFAWMIQSSNWDSNQMRLERFGEGSVGHEVVAENVPMSQELAFARDRLFFAARDGGDIWVSDGTLSSTRQTTLKRTGSSAGFTPVGDRMIVRSTGSMSHVDGLYVTDGTPSGTHAVSQHANTLGSFGGHAFLTLDGGLFETSGVGPGMTLVKSFRAEGTRSVPPRGHVNGSTVIWVQGADAGFDLWASRAGAVAERLTSMPELHVARAWSFVDIGSSVAVLIDFEGRMKIVTSDGTVAGTRRPAMPEYAVGGNVEGTSRALYSWGPDILRRFDLETGALVAVVPPLFDGTIVGVLGEAAYFTSVDAFGAHTLWRFDESGPWKVESSTPELSMIGRVDDRLCLRETRRDGGHSFALWSYRPGKLEFVRDSEHLSSPSVLDDAGFAFAAPDCRSATPPPSFELGVGLGHGQRSYAVGRWLVFEHPPGLGSDAGWTRFVDVDAGLFVDVEALGSIESAAATVDGTIYFPRRFDGVGTELARFRPGVSTGPELVADVRAGPLPSYPQGLRTADDRVVFWAYGDAGMQLFAIVPERIPDAGPMNGGFEDDAGVADAGSEAMDAGTEPAIPGRPKGCGCTSAPASFVLLALVSLVRSRSRR